MHSTFSVAAAGTLMAAALAGLAGPAAAQQRTIELEITHTYDGPATICVPLSLPEKYAGLREVIVEQPGGGPKSQLLGQLTAPGLLTEHIAPSAEGLVRRDLYCQFVGFKVKAGDKTKLTILLDAKPAFGGYGFDWTSKEGQYAELALNYGKMPVLRYLHAAYDKSSKEKRQQSARVFHRLFEFRPTKHPSNPGESRWNESDAGQFGCYFEYDLTEKKPLVVNYRLFVKPGVSAPGKDEFEMTQPEVEKLSTEFREPPKIKVIEAGKG
jgi:hypothetical protein